MNGKKKMDTIKRCGSYRIVLMAAAIMTAAMLLFGCGGASRDSASYEEAAAAETAAAMDSSLMAAPMAEGTGAANGGSMLISEAGAAGGILEGTENEDIEGGDADEPKDESGDQAADTGRKLIRTINLTVQTRDFDGLLKQIEDRTQAYGGYVESSWQSGASEYSRERSADIKVRIPAEHTDEFLETAVEGAAVTYRSEDTQDITLNYMDLSARMKALRTEQERLMELLSEADSIESVIAIESRLSEVRYEIESIESQLRSYDNRVSYSTITISISEVSVIEAGGQAGFSERIRTGLEKNLRGLKNGATELLILIITNLPLFIVIAVFAILIYIIVRMVLHAGRHAEKRRTGKDDKDSVEPDLKDGDDQGGKA